MLYEDFTFLRQDLNLILSHIDKTFVEMIFFKLSSERKTIKPDDLKKIDVYEEVANLFRSIVTWHGEIKVKLNSKIYI